DVAMHSSLRIMPCAISIGQGAGMGAAMAAAKGISPAEVDGCEVRRKLIEFGANLNENGVEK
ncbi:MAG: FAD-dependent oxidoreductase, partial [Lentisphaeria bacterium]|nr:FAD-dependent oxidoreductase [Lentisphaeria bacterium]